MKEKLAGHHQGLGLKMTLGHFPRVLPGKTERIKGGDLTVLGLLEST